MNVTEKNKLRHDFLNATVIINCMTNSAANFFNNIAAQIDKTDINQVQLEKFSYAMNAIREQMTKIEDFFHKSLEYFD